MIKAKRIKFYDPITFFPDEIPFHNTFREEKSKQWFKKKNHYLFFLLICIFQMGLFYGHWFLGATGYGDAELDNVPLILDLGSFAPLQKKGGASIFLWWMRFSEINM